MSCIGCFLAGVVVTALVILAATCVLGATTDVDNFRLDKPEREGGAQE